MRRILILALAIAAIVSPARAQLIQPSSAQGPPPPPAPPAPTTASTPLSSGLSEYRLHTLPAAGLNELRGSSEPGGNGPEQPERAAGPLR
jgi:hypothetical protein